ncbi:MAG: hypothetical protein AB1644_05850 [Candidatus Zixiibacteriota bacterium]
MVRHSFGILVAATIGFITPAALCGHTARVYVGAEIPDRVCLQPPGMISGSDSLFLNGRPVTRGLEYSYNITSRCFDLSRLPVDATDTLRITFIELPAWLNQSFGRPIPETNVPAAIQAAAPLTTSPPRTPFPGNMKISGYKSFRVSAGTSGETDFGQTLDLKVAGEISPGVTLTGAVSDRGYDPSYGSLNSRLNELDKLYLRLDSRRLVAQVGDITLSGLRSRPSTRLSGATFNLTFPKWETHATAARPQGRFASVKLSGLAGFQGPYQMGNENRAVPVVPGSERVWLDGVLMDRGADKDYTVDYPSGQITFNVNHPIDRRSRVEIDYEPLAAAYRQELLVAGGGIASADSLFFGSVEAIREGDDQGQPLSGQLTDADEQTLAMAGDSDLFRSGVTPDSAGDYILITDSLPDSVFQFVGAPNGDYRVAFSFVGRRRGTYRFLGNGNYRYVGADSGDYLPVILVARPERTVYYQSLFGIRQVWLGELKTDIRQSRNDRNLFSRIDDDDNDALYYQIRLNRTWISRGTENYVRGSTLSRDAKFLQRDRLVQPDLARSYFLPEGYIVSATEKIHEVMVRETPISGLTLMPEYGTLDYRDSFHSSRGRLSTEIEPVSWLRFVAQAQNISSDLRSVGGGVANTYATTLRSLPHDRLTVELGAEYDSRKNRYSIAERGTKYWQGFGAVTFAGESVRYERHLEDTLVNKWRRLFIRDRLTAGSGRTIGNFTYSLTTSLQQIADTLGEQRSFLGRGTFGYSDSRHNLSLTAAYSISDELRSARGIAYLEVEPGRGNYGLEEGRYIPDQNGNYIQVEEILSDRASVRRGQKSFQISKRWAQGETRFSSDIQEELLDDGKRNVLWALPFYSDPAQPYLFYVRRYNGDLRLIRWRDIYAVNFAYSEDREGRSVVGINRIKNDHKGSLALRQVSGDYYYTQTGELFRYDRDSYFAGGGVVNGYRLAASVRRTTRQVEFGVGGSFRHASSALDERSRIYTVTIDHLWRQYSRGELRTQIEFYRQDLISSSDVPSYQLIDNHFGKRGVLWSILFTYGARERVRINVSMSGRHADDRTARVTSRGELVAGF